jgi:hypothetical protein
MMMDEKPKGAWSVPVSVDAIPDAGLHLQIEAADEVRRGIAAQAGLRDVPRLTAVFDLVRHGARVQVTGQVRAIVGQTCVVSLEPMQSEIDEAVDLVFAPPPAGQTGGAAEGARKPAKAGEEPPEPLIDGAVDLGAVATEFLMLGIDPYPRKQGVEFSPPKAEDDTAHAFAALAALQKRPGTDRQ